MAHVSPLQSTSTAELKSWSKQFLAYHAVDEERKQVDLAVLHRVAELETALKNTQADLDDQISSRRQWRKRAEEVEARVSRNQFTMLLVDGNQYTFEAALVRSDVSGGAQASQQLRTELQSLAKKQHPSDIPEDVGVVVFVFADMHATAQAHVANGTVESVDQFHRFAASFSKSSRFMTFVDCGHGKEATAAKIKDFYELFLENCHCRHLSLALGDHSDYYEVLHTYAEDELTLSKTSLVRPNHGLPSQFTLPFNIADLSPLVTMPLISFEPSQVLVQRPAQRGSTSFDDLYGLRDVTARPPVSVDTHAAAVAASNNPAAQPKSPELPRSGSASGEGSGRVSGTSSATSFGLPASSGPAADLAVKASQHSEPASNLTTKRVGTQPSSSALKPETIGPPGPARPTHAKDVSVESPLRNRMGLSYAQDWENAPAQDIYTQPAILTPWGEEPEPSAAVGGEESSNWADSMNNIADSHHNAARRLDWVSRGAGRGSRRVLRTNDSGPASAESPRLSPARLAAGHGLTQSNYVSFGGSRGDEETLSIPIRSDIALNRAGQRIDVDLPQPSEEEHARFTERTGQRRLCNEHQLRRACRDTHCTRSHDEIDPGILKCLRIVARKLPCSQGRTCRRAECYYGHHCPFGKTNLACSNAKCPFNVRGMHTVSDFHVVARVPGQ